MFVLNKSFVICTMLLNQTGQYLKNASGRRQYAYSTGHFVRHEYLSICMIIFFMLVDTLYYTMCFKMSTMCNTDDVIKCRKCATQMNSFCQIYVTEINDYK